MSPTKPTAGHDAGREDLLAFQADQPKNYWDKDAHLRRVVAHYAGPIAFEKIASEAQSFGEIAATKIDPLVRLNDRRRNHPRLERFGAFGERLEAVEHHPSYHEIGRAIYGSGVIASLGETGGVLRSQTLGFLSGLNGEAGHNCPCACTAGLVKALRQLGSPAQREAYLPRLLSTDYDTLAHGAQFLTEVQGGSDVGINDLEARETEEEGRYTLHGEKWFCSNVTADLILLTGRPEGAKEGTRGLGLFIMPRRLKDGSLNKFQIRRLKDKLGTRSMPSAEIDLDGATAYALGPIEDGFKNMMTYVIGTSRLWNAVGTSAIARRAQWVAQAYASRRRAFEHCIADYPLVQETLADMRTDTDAMISGTFLLLDIADRLERAEAGEPLAEENQETLSAFHRMAVNLNKMRSAQVSHEVALSGIEVLGGNGAIESFSVLPRLLRDNVVYENWEGTHNVLLTQVLRDCRRLSMHKAFFEILHTMAEGDKRLQQSVKTAADAMEACLAGPDSLATLQMRLLGAHLAHLVWAVAMKQDGSPSEVQLHFWERRVGPIARRDESYLERIKFLALASAE